VTVYEPSNVTLPAVLTLVLTLNSVRSTGSTVPTAPVAPTTASVGLRRAVTMLIEVAWSWEGAFPSYKDQLWAAEHDGSPLAFREHPQAQVERAAPLSLPGSFERIGRARDQRLRVFHRRRSRPLAPQIMADVYRHLIQPAAEILRPLQLAQVSVKPEEDLLRSVLSIGYVAQKAERSPEHQPLVTPH